MSLLIKNATAILCDGAVVFDISVGITDDRITHIGAEPVGAYDDVIDANGGVLMAGLVNSHTHAAMNLLRGYGEDMPLQDWLINRVFPFEDKLQGVDVYNGTMLGIAEMIRSGTSSFTDMYYFCDDIAVAVAHSGIKANIGRGISCFDADKKFCDLPASDEIKSVAEQFHMSNNGRIRIDVAPHSEYTTRPDILEDAAQLASRLSLRMQTHISETEKEHNECILRYGITPIELMAKSGVLDNGATLAHCVWINDNDMDIINSYGATVSHCPKSNLKLASGVAPIDRMRKKGIAVAIGTDSAASNNRLDMFEDMRMAALLAKGVFKDSNVMPANEVLHMATRLGALSQGREDCGKIEIGCKADLLLLSAKSSFMNPSHNAVSNVVYAAGVESVRATIVDGKILYKDGEFLTIDIEKVCYNVGCSVKRILKLLNV